MDMSSVNWLAVVVVSCSMSAPDLCGIHPGLLEALVDEHWQEEDEVADPNPMLYVWTLLAAFVEAVFVSFLLTTMGSMRPCSGLTAGFMIWLGFVATTNRSTTYSPSVDSRTGLIEAGNHLVIC